MTITKRLGILLGILVGLIVITGGLFGYAAYQKANMLKPITINKTETTNPVQSENEKELEAISKEIEDSSLDTTELDTLSTELNSIDISSL